jgi:uncharacterized protein (DUF952 family)
MIFHITTIEAWENAKSIGVFEAPSLKLEGFIHTCTKEQTQAMLDRFYKNETNLILLHINEDMLVAPLKYELSPSLNQMFPHIFGPINIDAVVQAEAL